MSLHLDEQSISESEGSWESDEIEHQEEEVGSNDNRKEIQDLARKETVSVRRWRLVVVSLMAITGGILSTFTYRILRDEDRDDYIDAVSHVEASCVAPRKYVPLCPLLTTLSPFTDSTCSLLRPSKRSPLLASEKSTKRRTVWVRPSQHSPNPLGPSFRT